MTPDRARELISIQVSMGGGYNRNATKLILAEVYRLHGQQLVDQLIQEFNLNEIFDFKPGTKYTA